MGSAQHGGEVALGHLEQHPWQSPQEYGARLFPVVCGVGIAESHTESKSFIPLWGGPGSGADCPASLCLLLRAFQDPNGSNWAVTGSHIWPCSEKEVPVEISWGPIQPEMGMLVPDTPFVHWAIWDNGQVGIDIIPHIQHTQQPAGARCAASTKLKHLWRYSLYIQAYSRYIQAYPLWRGVLHGDSLPSEKKTIDDFVWHLYKCPVACSWLSFSVGRNAFELCTQLQNECKVQIFLVPVS